MSERRAAVKVTANFERNLGRIRDFLHEAGAAQAFDALLERLDTRLLPTIGRFPDIGADFAAKAPLSREGQVLFERMVALAGPDAEMRQIIEGDYVILYLVRRDSVYLLSIRHHRELSFDFAAHWP